MSDDAAECGAGRVGKALRGVFLVRGLSEADFHEFVAFERFIEGFQNGITHPAFTDHDDRLEGMREATQVPSLPSGQVERRS